MSVYNTASEPHMFYRLVRQLHALIPEQHKRHAPVMRLVLQQGCLYLKYGTMLFPLGCPTIPMVQPLKYYGTTIIPTPEVIDLTKDEDPKPPARPIASEDEYAPSSDDSDDSDDNDE